MVATNIWRIWANSLHRWGMENLIASILEAVGPLALLGAQVVYLGQPILHGILPANHLQALATLFEDNNQRQAFIAILREASQE
ncbi:MAG: hypothetical protein A2Z45_03470 [Chloroflexi bacterium RBG_19FT_COMBO_55_16]|nr:MAG: hypothetical protein A2Z45_03470 [Chloroflexi bacterium RBG_19FT_COMBO_55_16]